MKLILTALLVIVGLLLIVVGALSTDPANQNTMLIRGICCWVAPLTFGQLAQAANNTAQDYSPPNGRHNSDSDAR